VIVLHKLNGAEIRLNAELIECLEPRGKETVVALATGNKYLVEESAEAISDRIIEYRRKVNAQPKVANPIQGFARDNP
jgi:uncharacterized protein YlzI (FlbEa/FlbD family)